MTDSLSHLDLANSNKQTKLPDSFNKSNITYDGYISNIRSRNITTSNNGWNNTKTKTVKGWIDENKIYSWLLNEESKRYEKYDDRLTVPLMVLSASTGISSIGSLALDEEGIRTVSLIAGVIIILVNIVSMIVHRYEFGKKAQLLSLTSKKYSTMINDFKLILSEDIEERINGTIYLREKNKERNDLYENTPSISKSTWNKLAENIKNGNLLEIATSELLNDIVNKSIQIYTEIESETEEERIHITPITPVVDTITGDDESLHDISITIDEDKTPKKEKKHKKPHKVKKESADDIKIRQEIMGNLIKAGGLIA